MTHKHASSPIMLSKNTHTHGTGIGFCSICACSGGRTLARVQNIGCAIITMDLMDFEEVKIVHMFQCDVFVHEKNVIKSASLQKYL